MLRMSHLHLPMLEMNEVKMEPMLERRSIRIMRKREVNIQKTVQRALLGKRVRMLCKKHHGAGHDIKREEELLKVLDK